MKQKSEELGTSISKLKRMLTRFWQRGMSKNALLSDYINSGENGKNKQLGKSEVGRPKKMNYKV